MKRSLILKLIFVLGQFAGFAIIFGLQFYYGPTSVYLNEWIRASWCLLISIVIVVSLCVAKLREWMPYLEDGWKLAITVALLACLSFRAEIINVRTFIAFGLLAASVAYFILMFSLPETRPKFGSEKSDVEIVDENQIPSVHEIENFSHSQVKYMQMDEHTENISHSQAKYKQMDEHTENISHSQAKYKQFDEQPPNVQNSRQY